MKTKTTLAALLLAAVMVTPSYGAESNFLDGAKECLRFHQNKKIENGTDFGFFYGYLLATFDAYKVDAPDDVKLGQVANVVARYVYNHPEHHHLCQLELVKRACKEAWPDENKHVFISR